MCVGVRSLIRHSDVCRSLGIKPEEEEAQRGEGILYRRDSGQNACVVTETENETVGLRAATVLYPMEPSQILDMCAIVRSLRCIPSLTALASRVDYAPVLSPLADERIGQL